MSTDDNPPESISELFDRAIRNLRSRLTTASRGQHRMIILEWESQYTENAPRELSNHIFDVARVAEMFYSMGQQHGFLESLEAVSVSSQSPQSPIHTAPQPVQEVPQQQQIHSFWIVATVVMVGVLVYVWTLELNEENSRIRYKFMITAGASILTTVGMLFARFWMQNFVTRFLMAVVGSLLFRLCYTAALYIFAKVDANANTNSIQALVKARTDKSYIDIEAIFNIVAIVILCIVISLRHPTTLKHTTK